MKKLVCGVVVLFAIFCLALPIQTQERSEGTGGELYDSGMALFNGGNYKEAIETFFRLIDSSSRSKLVSYSQFMIAQCYLKMERHEAAIEQFSLYLKTYPDGDRVKAAEQGIRISEEKLKEKAPVDELPSTPVPSMPASPNPGTVVNAEPASEEPKKVEREIIVEEIRRVEVQPVAEEAERPETGTKPVSEGTEKPEAKSPPYK